MKTVNVLFIRSFLPQFDGRLQKYKLSLNKENIEWHFLGWNRDGDSKAKLKGTTLFTRKALVGGGMKNIINIIYWNIFIAKFLIKNRKSYSWIHVVDFDSAILAIPIAKILRKKIIFDIYDKYTSARKMPLSLSVCIDYLENYFIEKSTFTFLVDNSRIGQHGITNTSNIRIFENIPTTTDNYKSSDIKDFPLKIGYLGVFEKDIRGLENMLSIAAKSKNIEFHIAGLGTIEVLVQNYAKQFPKKIIYYGPLEHEEGMKMMGSMHIALALYYKSIPNHLFAAPNKYYEHLMLGQPLITTLGTPPGEKVTKFKTGWAIEDTKEELENLLSKITLEDIDTCSHNAKKLWDSRYSNYLEKKYFNEYICIIKSK